MFGVYIAGEAEAQTGDESEETGPIGTILVEPPLTRALSSCHSPKPGIHILLNMVSEYTRGLRATYSKMTTTGYAICETEIRADAGFHESMSHSQLPMTSYVARSLYSRNMEGLYK